MKKEINVNAAVLKLIACVGVVALHTFGALSSIDSFASNAIWYTFCFSIPIFFSMSGYFGLRRIGTWKAAFLKIIGIFGLIFAWCFALFFVQLIRTGGGTNPFVNFALAFLQMGSFPRYWFFGALIILYLLNPLLSKLFQNNRTAIILFAFSIVLCFVSFVVNMVSISAHGYSIYDYNYVYWLRQSFRLWIPIAYYCVGGLMQKDFVMARLSKIGFIPWVCISVILLIASVAYQILLGKAMVYNSPEFHHDSPIIFALVMSLIATFMFFHEKRTSNRLFIRISNSTLGIYVLHGWVSAFIQRYLFVPNNILLLFGYYLIVIFVSLLVYLVMSFIPGINVFVDISWSNKIYNWIGKKRKRCHE